MMGTSNRFIFLSLIIFLSLAVFTALAQVPSFEISPQPGPLLNNISLSAGIISNGEILTVTVNGVSDPSGIATVRVNIQATGVPLISFNLINQGNGVYQNSRPIFSSDGTYQVEIVATDSLGYQSFQTSATDLIIGSPPSTCTDNDNDGYGDPGDATCYRNSSQRDCDDNNPNINPSAVEICDGIEDDDCDGLDDANDPDCSGASPACDFDNPGDACYGANVADAGCSTSNTSVDWFHEPSGDTWCATSGQCYCQCPAGRQWDSIDCQLVPTCTDNDGDGYGNPGDASCDNGSQQDCNDTLSYIYPGATETCNNEDDNCDTVTDEGCDNDGDLYCDSGMTFYGPNVTACSSTAVADNVPGDDCDDSDINRNPAATEICDNNIDENCNGLVDENCTCTEDWTCTDWSECSSGIQTRICSDSNNCDTTNNQPSEMQTCSNICTDSDRDGYGSPASSDCFYFDLDCNDSEFSINPGAFDICQNGIDEDCSGNDALCTQINLAIIEPNNNSIYSIGDWFNLHAIAIGGTGPYTYSWSSDLDGYLGEGEWFFVNTGGMAPNLDSLGDHIITLAVEDANNQTAFASIKITINPEFTLSANINMWPSDFTTGEMISFNSIITGGQAPYTITWNSDQMGDFSTQQAPMVDTQVTPWTTGPHQIRLTVEDSLGAQVEAYDIITISDVLLRINPVTGSNFYVQEDMWLGVYIIGSLPAPYTYTWQSDQNGVLINETTNNNWHNFIINSLNQGVHIITLTVTDSLGRSIQEQVQIQINPIDPNNVACFDYSDCTDTNSCTEDVCNNPGLMSSFCSHTPLTLCQDDDSCCPSTCNSSNDNNCTASADNDDPKKVLIVYNDQCARDDNNNGLSDYQELAEYYQLKRNVPDTNVLAVYPSVGSGGCAYYYQSDKYPDFYSEVVETIQNKISILGENDIYYLLLIGLPTRIYVDLPTYASRSLDHALVTLYDLQDPAGFPTYYRPCTFGQYCTRVGYSSLDEPRFNHSFRFNGNNIYLVSRIHDPQIIDRALYGEQYIYNQAGYYRGQGYIDTRYQEYTDDYLDDYYPFFSGYTSYDKGDRLMAYGKRIFDLQGWDYKWEAASTEIGEAGAVFTDGSSAESVNDALWYEGWYNYGRYLDVWNWKAGAIACDTNSNSAAMNSTSFLRDAFNNGLTAGTGVTAEPFLSGHPHGEVFLHYMLNGYNFAESSQLSYPGFLWRDISYGDPLYNPNKAKIPILDTFSPNISQIFAESNVSDASTLADITIRLDLNSTNPEVATYRLEYGLDASYGTDIDFDEIYSTQKTFEITNLSPDTTYHYRVHAKDPVGNVTESIDMALITSPNSTTLPSTVDATASSQVGPAPLTVDFISSFGQAPTQIEWNFADGSSTQEQNPSHTFSRGFYPVVLYAEFANGLTAAKEILIIAK